MCYLYIKSSYIDRVSGGLYLFAVLRNRKSESLPEKCEKVQIISGGYFFLTNTISIVETLDFFKE